MTTDLTKGKIFKTLFFFSLPMLISVIFQQLYGMIDTIFIGQAVGEIGLAAMGASFPLVMITMSVAIGYCVGSSIILAQLFAKKEIGKLKTAIFTTMITAVVLAVITTAIGVGISEPLLRAIGTPTEKGLFKMANEYQYIVIGAGSIVAFLYNAVVGVYQALGNTKLPLLFLIISTIINIILDYIFVMVLKWGIAGAAWATVISEIVACILAMSIIFVHLKKMESEPYKKFSFKNVLSSVKISIPIMLQQMSIFIGALLIQNVLFKLYPGVPNPERAQKIINTTAGYTISGRLLGLAVMCIFQGANGLSNFTAQNIAVGEYKRIKKGFWVTIGMAIFISLVFVTIFESDPNGVMDIFSKNMNEDSRKYAKILLVPVSPIMIILAVKMCGDCILRGSGGVGYFFASTFIDLVIRVALSYILAPKYGVAGIAAGFIVGWIVSAILSIIFVLTKGWKRKYERKVRATIFTEYPERYA